ncbi:MAG: ribosomal protein S18-alanine N-acetyltransferase [Lachnospiraceae bacterium]|nr:ribosomal protein S18-alanine N-acetyltransferase [Lachnospiraceae bacterium]
MIEIRELQKQDIDQISEIEKRCFSDPWSRESFEEVLTSPSFLCLVVLLDGKIAGYVVIIIAADECEIVNVATDISFRRQGIASKLLESVFALSKTNKVRAYYLEVRESNVTAKGLYSKYGFVEIGVRKKYYKNPVEDAILMRRLIIGEV